MLLDRLEDYYLYFCKRKSGWCILFCIALFTGIGLIILSSASLSFIKSESYFFKQLSWCAFSAPSFLVGCFVDLKFLKKYSTQILFILFVTLILVLIPGIGRMVNGSRRWITVGGNNVQVSELAKIGVIIWVSKYINNNCYNGQLTIEKFVMPLGITGIICALIFLEPDYGTAILIGSVAFTLLFLAGSKLRYMVITMALGLAGILLLIYFNPTRMRRITAFLDFEGNKLGGAYQLWQGILGFASGGLFGRGLGEGRQQIMYLPEPHTDFIFPILSEEMGSIFSCVLLVCYFLFFTSSMFAASRLKRKFSKFMSYGISLTISYQVVINIGVVTGLLPTKGMVLPFISYGGSSIVLLMLMVGLLLNALSSEIRSYDKDGDQHGISGVHNRHMRDVLEA